MFLKVVTSVLCQRAVLTELNARADCMRSIEGKRETIECGHKQPSGNASTEVKGVCMCAHACTYARVYSVL